QGRKLVALRYRRRLQGGGSFHHAPLFPDTVGIGWLVGDRPVQVPETCITRCFIKQPGYDEVLIADSSLRQTVCRDESTKAFPHASAFFQRAGLLLNNLYELCQRSRVD